MANVKISNLPSTSEVGNNDLLIVSKKNNDGSYSSVSVSVSDISDKTLNRLSDKPISNKTVTESLNTLTNKINDSSLSSSCSAYNVVSTSWKDQKSFTGTQSTSSTKFFTYKVQHDCFLLITVRCDVLDGLTGGEGSGVVVRLGGTSGTLLCSNFESNLGGSDSIICASLIAKEGQLITFLCYKTSTTGATSNTNVAISKCSKSTIATIREYYSGAETLMHDISEYSTFEILESGKQIRKSEDDVTVLPDNEEINNPVYYKVQTTKDIINKFGVVSIPAGSYLVPDVDYILVYENNDTVGTATVKAQGIGEFNGVTNSDTFEIVES